MLPGEKKLAIITYECDSSPEGIRKRLERKNTKYSMACALQKIHFIRHDEKLTDEQKLKKIGEEMLTALY